MLPDRVSDPGPLTYESGALPIALRGPATKIEANTGFDRPNCWFNHVYSVKENRRKKTVFIPSKKPVFIPLKKTVFIP